MDIPSVNFFFLFPKYCGPRCSITLRQRSRNNQAIVRISLISMKTKIKGKRKKMVLRVFFRVDTALGNERLLRTFSKRKRDRQKHSAKYRFVSRKETAIRQSLATRARQPVHLLNLTSYVDVER